MQLLYKFSDVWLRFSTFWFWSDPKYWEWVGGYQQSSVLMMLTTLRYYEEKGHELIPDGKDGNQWNFSFDEVQKSIMHLDYIRGKSARGLQSSEPVHNRFEELFKLFFHPERERKNSKAPSLYDLTFMDYSVTHILTLGWVESPILNLETHSRATHGALGVGTWKRWSWTVFMQVKCHCHFPKENSPELSIISNPIYIFGISASILFTEIGFWD